MDLDTNWYAYQCHSGEVLFYYNSLTGEHKWAVHFCSCLKPKSVNSQPEPCCTWQPIKAKSSESGKFVRSIGTETEDRYFTNNLDHHKRNISLEKRGTFVQNEEECNTPTHRSMATEARNSSSRENMNTEQASSSIYCPESIGPVEVVLSDPFLTESEKTSVFPKRLTLKLADSSRHGLSVSRYSDPTEKKLPSEAGTNDSANSLDEESEEGESSPQILQMKENIFANLKRELPSFCVDNNLQNDFVSKPLKRPKTSTTSSRKNPEPRKLVKRMHSAEGTDSGSLEEEAQDNIDDVGEELEFEEENMDEFKKVYFQNPMVKVELNNPSASTSSTNINEDSTSEEPVSTICTLCSKECHNPTDLTNHIMYHQPTGTRCPICQKVFSRRQGLRYHVQTHSGDKPHICKLCNKTFTKAASLVAHVRIHYGIKPFKCPKCSKEFTHSGNLSSHLRIHSALRPYRCKFCAKGFKTSSHLSLHMKSHSDARPYKCSDCGKAFKNSSHLKSHRKVHSIEKNVICGSCNEGFRNFSELMGHQRTNSQCHGIVQHIEMSDRLSGPSHTEVSEQPVELDADGHSLDNMDLVVNHDLREVGVIET